MVKDFEDTFESLKDNMYLECNTNDEFQQRRGTLTILSRFLSYENTVKTIHEQLMEAEKGDDNGSEDL